MLVSLADIKSYLGISGSTYDTFLTEQEEIISQAVENYCGRKFLQATYVQTFYCDDYSEKFTQELKTFHFPIITMTSVLDGTVNVTTDLRINKDMGSFKNPDGLFVEGDTVVATYSAGYAVLPAPIKSVVLSLVEERYNKKVSGVSLNFGSDVQGISIPGTISVQFDYSLQSNERRTAFGTILGNYVNSLDYYRSERKISGGGTISYVS